MNIKSKAPARIDLAGGTLDLWPLYLFYDKAATINCAIDQFAEVQLTTGENSAGAAPSIELVSQDRKTEKTFASFDKLVEAFASGHQASKLPPALWLHAKLARHFYSLWRKPSSLKIATSCAAPAGAGLGGSSALNIALCSALRELTQADYNNDELIALARDLETTVIDVPAGVQDYWSALFGGVQAIVMEPARMHRKVFANTASFLEQHIILCYTGHSRNSGINNWAVYKAFIDKHEGIRSAFRQIVDATETIQEALERKSFEKLIDGIDKEWQARQELAPTIATPEMLAIIDRARELGAKAAKVCGAGGGGCFIMVAPDDKRQAISDKLKAGGAHIIDFKVVEEGCKLDGSTSAGR